MEAGQSGGLDPQGHRHRELEQLPFFRLLPHVHIGSWQEAWGNEGKGEEMRVHELFQEMHGAAETLLGCGRRREQVPETPLPSPSTDARRGAEATWKTDDASGSRSCTCS